MGNHSFGKIFCGKQFLIKILTETEEAGRKNELLNSEENSY